MELRSIILTLDDVFIFTEEVEGYSVMTDGDLTLALDVTLTDELRLEGEARELVSQVQKLRRSGGFKVTDIVTVRLNRGKFEDIVSVYGDYVRSQTLCSRFELVDSCGISVEKNALRV